MGRNNSKKRKLIFFRTIGMLSALIATIFCILLVQLDMIPASYLSLFLIITCIFYIIMLFLTLNKKIKTKIKVVCCVILILIDIVFGFGIKYLGKTINFFDIINNNLAQREVYYLMTLDNSKVKSIKDLKNENIGIYESKNTDKVIEEVEKKIEFDSKKYTDVVDMFDDLSDKKIKAVVISGSIKNLLNDELDYLKIELKEIEKIYVKIEEKDIVKVVDVTRTPFNIYVAGGDSYGSIDHVTNTDVNMVITVDPVNRKILLTSIPRDYYVNLPGQGENAYDKLTHAGYYGIEESILAVEKLLDIDINYYVKVNFSTIEKVVDAIGGVDVNSTYDFYEDSTYNHYHFKKGINHLNGSQALAFARERHAFKDGDVQRVKNQQKVIEAAIKKVTSSTTLVTNFSEILDSVSSSLSTNMDTKSINKFVKMQLRDMSGWNIDSQNLIGSDLRAKTYTFPSMELYVMKQNPESVSTCSTKIKEYLEK